MRRASAPSSIGSLSTATSSISTPTPGVTRRLSSGARAASRRATTDGRRPRDDPPPRRVRWIGMLPEPELRLRAARPEEAEFFYALRKEAFQPYFEQVFGPWL